MLAISGKLHCHSIVVQNDMSGESVKKQEKIMCPHALFLQAQLHIVMLMLRLQGRWQMFFIMERWLKLY